MKNFIKLLLFLFLLIQSVQAEEILVLPVDLLSQKENYYSFDEVSEIVSNDIIKEFKKSGGKITSPDLCTTRAKINANSNLKQILENSLNKYKTSGTIDYKSFKAAADNFNCKYVLLVTGSVVTNKNSIKRGVWEILELSSAFDISYPFRLETSVVLLDTSNELVMWSNNYSTKLGNNNNTFIAKNYAQANAEYEKIKMYSQLVTAPATAQNVVLRFYPKSIRPINQEVTEQSGGVLRFDKNIPEKPKLRPRDDFYGDTLFGI